MAPKIAHVSTYSPKVEESRIKSDSIFIDTGVLCAFFNDEDDLHDIGRRLFVFLDGEKQIRLYVPFSVIVELWGLLDARIKNPKRLQRARELALNWLSQPGKVEIIFTDLRILRIAIDIHLKDNYLDIVDSTFLAIWNSLDTKKPKSKNLISLLTIDGDYYIYQKQREPTFKIIQLPDWEDYLMEDQRG